MNLLFKGKIIIALAIIITGIGLYPSSAFAATLSVSPTSGTSGNYTVTTDRTNVYTYCDTDDSIVDQGVEGSFEMGAYDFCGLLTIVVFDFADVEYPATDIFNEGNDSMWNTSAQFIYNLTLNEINFTSGTYTFSETPPPSPSGYTPQGREAAFTFEGTGTGSSLLISDTVENYALVGVGQGTGIPLTYEMWIGNPNAGGTKYEYSYTPNPALIVSFNPTVWASGQGDGEYYFKLMNNNSTTDYLVMCFTVSESGTEYTPHNCSWGTRVVSVTPYLNETIATSTAALFGSTVYVESSDFAEGMYVKQSFYNIGGVPSNQVAGPAYSVAGAALGETIYNTVCGWLPSWLCTPTSSGGTPIQQPVAYNTFNHEITDSGTSTFADTWSMQVIGNYTMVTSIYTPSSFLGIQFGNGNLIASMQTNFTVATTSSFDRMAITIHSQVDDFFTKSDANNCTLDWTTAFGIADMGDCLLYLFVSNQGTIWDNFTGQIADIATRAPWGYATRAYTIFTSNTATSTLPSIAAVCPPNLPCGGTGTPMADFSPWVPIDNTIDHLSTTIAYGQTEPVMDNFLFWWNTLWYIMLAIWVLRKFFDVLQGIDFNSVPPQDYAMTPTTARVAQRYDRHHVREIPKVKNSRSGRAYTITKTKR